MDAPEITVPSLDRSLRWLRERSDPVVDLALARHVDDADPPVIDGLRGLVHEVPLVRSSVSTQHDDGSWGASDDVARRILPTLRTLQTLVAVGAEHHPDVRRAAAFLVGSARTPAGVFTIDGRPGGVLSCYVGMAASCFLATGEGEAAADQLGWIREHQEVRVHGEELRDDEPCVPDEALRTRYGGCMSDTTCLLGLVKAGHAVRAHVEATGGDPVDRGFLAAVREAFLRRSLFLSGDGRTVPLGVPPKRADEWLFPTFPLDHRTDLVEVLHLVAATGPPDERLGPAVDVLIGQQLDDGSWPSRRALWPEHVTVRTRRDRRRGEAMATLRTTLALAAMPTDRDRARG